MGVWSGEASHATMLEHEFQIVKGWTFYGQGFHKVASTGWHK